MDADVVVVVVKASIIHSTAMSPFTSSTGASRESRAGTTAILLLLGHQRFEALQDARDRRSWASSALNLFGLLQYRLGVLIRIFGTFVGGASLNV